MIETTQTQSENPYNSAHSGYGFFDGQTLKSAYEPGSTMRDFHQQSHDYFRDLVQDPQFACIAAQAALKVNQYAFCAYKDITSVQTASGICHDLFTYAKQFGLSAIPEQKGIKFVSFVAAFNESNILDQASGVEQFYTLLKHIHEYDQEFFDWDPNTSNDPSSENFSFSIAAQSFFIPFLYEHSGSTARKSTIPMVVFNAHALFEKLRKNGAYAALKERIRARQIANGWAIHPFLGDHGEVTEFDQYALVDPTTDSIKTEKDIRQKILGTCPFKHA